MQKSLPAPFPRGMERVAGFESCYKAVWKRFIVDQTVPEFLVEFLLVVQSEKRIGICIRGLLVHFLVLSKSGTGLIQLDWFTDLK